VDEETQTRLDEEHSLIGLLLHLWMKRDCRGPPELSFSMIRLTGFQKQLSDTLPVIVQVQLFVTEKINI